jgi:hypothetical protein
MRGSSEIPPTSECDWTFVLRRALGLDQYGRRCPRLSGSTVASRRANGVSSGRHGRAFRCRRSRPVRGDRAAARDQVSDYLLAVALGNGDGRRVGAAGATGGACRRAPGVGGPAVRVAVAARAGVEVAPGVLVGPGDASPRPPGAPRWRSARRSAVRLRRRWHAPDCPPSCPCAPGARSSRSAACPGSARSR